MVSKINLAQAEFRSQGASPTNLKKGLSSHIVLFVMSCKRFIKALTSTEKIDTRVDQFLKLKKLSKKSKNNI